MNKFLVEFIRFGVCVGLFYFLSIPIFDFITPNYPNRFDLAWSTSIIFGLFFEKLYEIKDLLKNGKNE